MKKTILAVISTILLLTFVLSGRTAPIPQSQDYPSYLIDNLNIIDVETGAIRKNQSLLITDGKIERILSQSEVLNYQDRPRKDAMNSYVMPGLIDMHVHGYVKNAFELTLSHGITHTRILNGIPEHLEWREEQRQGKWLASSLSVSSPITHSTWDTPLSWKADTADEAREIARQAKRQGYDLIKAYGSMNAESLSALLDEAQALGIPVAKHGPHPPEGMTWNKLSQLQSMEHVEDIYQGILDYKRDLEGLPSAVEKVKELNVPITPTLNIYWQLTRITEDKMQFLNSLPEGYISPVIEYEEMQNQVKRWLDSSEKMAIHNRKTFSFLQQITQALEESDIPLLVGSDAGVLLSPYGLATLNEMALMNQAGLSNLSVLQAATMNAANALALTDEIGFIKEGLNADLLILKESPLSDLKALHQPLAVVKDGNWLSEDDLLSLRKNAVESKSLRDELLTIIFNY